MALVRTDDSEEFIASIIRVTRIGEPGTKLVVTGCRKTLRLLPLFRRSVFRLLVTANVVLSSTILVTLMMEAIHSFETSVLTKVTRRNIAESGIFHGHRREKPQFFHEFRTVSGYWRCALGSC
jgi:TRAP-type uncharacterized transport system fused permease subunit